MFENCCEIWKALLPVLHNKSIFFKTVEHGCQVAVQDIWDKLEYITSTDYVVIY